ncbi:hypothetical protein [Mycobacterium lentiflavum]|uniref:hypothetical protein n=1 Tax=Mycobacterium lentiflavum TaxID=141349 RepID=UPI001586A150
MPDPQVPERAQRRTFTVLDAAYRIHPERFARKSPEPPALPIFSAINPPSKEEEPTR